MLVRLLSGSPLQRMLGEVGGEAFNPPRPAAAKGGERTTKAGGSQPPTPRQGFAFFSKAGRGRPRQGSGTGAACKAKGQSQSPSRARLGAVPRPTGPERWAQHPSREDDAQSCFPAAKERLCRAPAYFLVAAIEST